MKSTLLIAALLGGTVGAYAQGTVTFDNRSGTTFSAPFYGLDPANPYLSQKGNSSIGIPAGTTVYNGPLLSGVSYTAQLWGRVGTGQSEASLEPLATTYFRTGAGAGWLVATTAVVPNVPMDGNIYYATFQVRVWDNMGGTVTSWAQALAVCSIPKGVTDRWDQGPLGGTGTPPATPPVTTGMRSFNIFLCPEPSVMALSAVGLGALLLRWRRR